MGLNDTATAERLHIGFFGTCNAGKSSLVNAVTAQTLSIVSAVRGTTTDPVKKTMELLPLGPVVIFDTPGTDDDTALGKERTKKTEQVLAKTDIAVLVVDATAGKKQPDRDLTKRFQERNIPFITVYNKADLLEKRPALDEGELYVSAATGEGVKELKERLGSCATAKAKKPILADLITAGDIVVLVTPIDESAPKGRIILPQQMTLREILDTHATAIVCQDSELKDTLAALAKKPALVVTDSQVFDKAAAATPADIPLTSFSILMARYKGDLAALVRGFQALSGITDEDHILISEGCTHHRQCNDIGTVKLPSWIRSFTAADPKISFTSGGEFPEDLSPYKVIVHCGGCMLNEKEMQHRIARARAAGVPMVNYGVAIAGMRGILARSLQLFPDILSILNRA